MENIDKNKNILTCKKIKFYSRKDEDAFFEWIKKITCIEKTSAAGGELYVHIASHDLHDHDLRDLLGLFFRYKINMKQLRKFLSTDNQKWFYDNKEAYWHHKVFSEETVV